MARVFITGSSDGLGLMAAKLLIEQGHEVVLHGRNEGRSRDALRAAAGVEGAVSGDISTIAGATTVANEVNKLKDLQRQINELLDRMDRMPANDNDPNAMKQLQFQIARLIEQIVAAQADVVTCLQRNGC